MFQGKAFLLGNMAEHFRTASKLSHCCCCLFHLLVHILICLLRFYLLSLPGGLGSSCGPFTAEESFRGGNDDFMAHSSPLSPMAPWGQALGFNGCFLTEAQEQKVLVLTLLANFLTLLPYLTRKEENPGIILGRAECAWESAFFPKYFQLSLTCLSSSISYRNYVLGAEAVPYMATVTAYKAKKELRCYLSNE